MSSHYTLGIQSFSDDGLAYEAAEPWFLSKTALICRSAEMFVARLAGYADEFVLIDLFSGSGLFALGNDSKRWAGTALTLLGSNLPFKRWILCERNPNDATSLRIRTRRYFRDRHVLVFEDPFHSLPEKLMRYVPQSSRNYRVAAFCIADSFSLTLPFDFIEKTLPLKLNFIIPFTFCLNSRNDYKFYLREQRDKLQRFLGRAPEDTALSRVAGNRNFYKYLVRVYHQQMMLMGLGGSLSVHPLDSGLMELPAFYVGLFTSIQSVRGIQREVQQQAFTQLTLF